MASFINGTLGKFSSVRVPSVISSYNAARNALGSLFSTKNVDNDIKLSASEKNITKSVFISQSNDIFTNLAIEDWIYKNNDLSKHHILLVWRNNPCVVIGRHQNPWLEVNLDYLQERGIDIARRNSGGGTVYHDRGNLNLTFFTPRDHYNRRTNLEVVKRALFREFNLNVDISSREDLLFDNYYKVSGTASKLGRNNAYHHCTLLIDAEKNALRNCLRKTEDEFETNATRSIPSPIKNLRETHPHVTPERVLASVGWEFLRTSPLSLQDGGQSMISKQRGFQLINPTDKWFPGMAHLRDELRSWEWRFGKTPKFTASRNCSQLQDSRLELKVEKGTITDLAFRVSASSGALAKSETLSELRGHRYTANSLEFLERAFAEPEPEAQALRALNA